MTSSISMSPSLRKSEALLGSPMVRKLEKQGFPSQAEGRSRLERLERIRNISIMQIKT